MIIGRGRVRGPLVPPPGPLPRHPDARPPGRDPRWQQAYGVDHHDAGRTDAAQPVPPELDPFQDRDRRAIDHRLHGLLVNWYDGDLGHCNGPHHDSVKETVRGAPIVTISLGEERNVTARRVSAPGAEAGAWRCTWGAVRR
jgi:hypothetical protein